jgi:hypothetical protein
MGTLITGFTVIPDSNVVIGTRYSSSVMRSCNMPLIVDIADSDGVDEKTMRYLLDRSSRDMEDKPQAEHIDVAFDENADVNVMRGPNSTTIARPPPTSAMSSRALLSNRNPSTSNVSRSNHSSRDVDTSSRGWESICTLKQYSASMDTTSQPPDDSCSPMDGRRECGVSVLR